ERALVHESEALRRCASWRGKHAAKAGDCADPEHIATRCRVDYIGHWFVSPSRRSFLLRRRTTGVQRHDVTGRQPGKSITPFSHSIRTGVGHMRPAQKWTRVTAAAVAPGFRLQQAEGRSSQPPPWPTAESHPT